MLPAPDPSESRRAPAFFEALVAKNVGIGRLEGVAVVLACRIQKNTKGVFRTRTFGPGTEVNMELRDKNSRVKQYLTTIDHAVTDPFTRWICKLNPGQQALLMTSRGRRGGRR